MEYLPNGFTLEICPEGFPLSTDSMLLSHFAKLPRNARVLDLGSGCGTLGLLLCANHPQCQVVGLELSEAAHRCATENIARNGLQGRMESRLCDLREAQIAAGSFDCCISNPPYFAGGPEAKLRDARREDHCSPEALFATAAKALKFGGDFFLVHRPERLAQLCSCACAAGLEPKRLQLVRHREDAPVSLVLLACRKGGKPGLSWEELTLHHADGTPTAQYNAIYHI